MQTESESVQTAGTPDLFAQPTGLVSKRGTRKTWIASGVALAVLLLGSGWYFLESRTRPVAGPDEGSLTSGLTTELPPYVKLSALQIQSSGSTGDNVEPVVTTRFRARFVLTADTFEQSSVEGDAVIVIPRVKEGTVREIGGVALSRLSGGTWKTQFSLDDNPIPGLGRPRESFQGARVIVQGSAEETAFREEQRLRREEQERLAQAQREEQLAEQRRLDEARRQAERTKLEAEIEAERRRAEAARAAELRNAEVEAQRRREELAAQESVSGERRRQTEEAAEFVEIPARTELNVRLSNTLNSGTAKVEDRFEATTTEDLTIRGRMVAPAGSIMRGIVASVQQATRTNRTARMTLSFDQLTINSRSYPIRGRATRVIAGEGLKGEAARIATGGAVGAIIGGILGGAKGALAGIGIGAGGTIAATEGKEVELPQGTVLRVRIESAVQVR